jgi:hypothetical protein
MIDRKFTTVDGVDYYITQSKDAKQNLGISKTYFHTEADKYAWKKEPGEKNSVFYYVPREYAEKRWAQMEALRLVNDQLFTNKGNAVVDHLSKPLDEPLDSKLNIDRPQDSINNAQTAEVFATLLDDTFSRLLDEKDHRIRQLEEALERERQHSQEIVKSKDNELNTIKGTLLLLTDKSNENSLHKTLEYSPTQPEKPFSFFSKLKFWE